jgi:hypothetical protein
VRKIDSPYKENDMKLLIAMMMMVGLVASAAEEKKVLTPEEQKTRDALVKEFGIYGSEYKTSTKYQLLTYKLLNLSKDELKNKEVRYEGVFKEVEDTFPSYMEDSGYASKKYFKLTINDNDIPVMALKSKEMIELLDKLKRGHKVLVSGRLKQFKEDSKHGNTPRFCLELAHLQVLALEPEHVAEEGGGAGKHEHQDRKKKKK